MRVCVVVAGVLALVVAAPSSQSVPQDGGAAGAWQKLLEAARPRRA